MVTCAHNTLHNHLLPFVPVPLFFWPGGHCIPSPTGEERTEYGSPRSTDRRREASKPRTPLSSSRFRPPPTAPRSLRGGAGPGGAGAKYKRVLNAEVATWVDHLEKYCRRIDTRRSGSVQQQEISQALYKAMSVLPTTMQNAILNGQTVD